MVGILPSAQCRAERTDGFIAALERDLRQPPLAGAYRIGPDRPVPSFRLETPARAGALA